MRLNQLENMRIGSFCAKLSALTISSARAKRLAAGPWLLFPCLFALNQSQAQSWREMTTSQWPAIAGRFSDVSDRLPRDIHDSEDVAFADIDADDFDGDGRVELLLCNRASGPNAETTGGVLRLLNAAGP